MSTPGVKIFGRGYKACRAPEAVSSTRSAAFKTLAKLPRSIRSRPATPIGERRDKPRKGLLN